MATATSPTTESKEDAAGGVDDYLQSPKKKRKNYVVLAISPKFDEDLLAQLESSIKTNYQGLSTVRVKSSGELLKYASRQVQALIIDDYFLNITENMETIQTLKERKALVPLPVIFLTESPQILVQEYNRLLLPYQEIDSYLDIHHYTATQLFTHMQQTLEGKPQKRRSRRYKVNLKIKYLNFSQEQFHDATLSDISLHGGVINALRPSDLFVPSDQIKISIPVARFLSHENGDFLRLAARIRTVFLEGNKAAFSWEFLTEKQTAMLTKFITEMVTNQFALGKR